MGDTRHTQSSIGALRDAFGDNKPPDISRKITACVACRKQKIKCQRRNGETQCTRCKRRGLSCTVNRSLQMLLEDDVSWKDEMEQKINKLESIVANLTSTAPLPPEREPRRPSVDVNNAPDSPSCIRVSSAADNNNNSNNNKDGHDDQQEPSPSRPVFQVSAPQSKNAGEIVMDLDSGPSTLPGFYVSEPSNNNSKTASPLEEDDFISRGLISRERAQEYFFNYQNRLDHFPYRILGDVESPPTLDSIRATSPLLAAAVCAVGSLHLASRDFDTLYNEFVSLTAKQSVSRVGTIDDVRALCIGAFWLGNDLSWSLSATAVRLATDLQLHRSFSKVIASSASVHHHHQDDNGNKKQHYLRARLYFLVYACDHHLSIPYGRPPMTRECHAVRDVRRLLECEHATEDDARLVSQVLRWRCCTAIFDEFGVDNDVVHRPRDHHHHHHRGEESVPSIIRRFGMELDGLRAEWGERFGPSAHVGNYPRKGVGLQYHFAKLYLYSHAFRGAGGGGGSRGGGETMSSSSLDHHNHHHPDNDITLELEEIANSAFSAALAIVRTVVGDPEIQSFLDGLPAYFDTMIAFAAVFLLKASSSSSNKFFSSSVVQLVDVQGIRNLLNSLVETLARVTSTMHRRHLLVSITRGIESILNRHHHYTGASVRSGGHAGLNNSGGATLSNGKSVATQGPSQSQEEGGGEVPSSVMDWDGGLDLSFDPYFLADYDFLQGQDINFDFDTL